MIALTVKRFGGSAGVLLPAEVMERMRLKIGDTIILEEDGAGYRLGVGNTEFVEQVAKGEAIMREDRAILQRLAR